jgi:DNA-binding transcriptional ArsR family regulator
MVSIAEDRFDIDQGIFFLDEMFERRKGYVSVVFGHNPRTSKPRFAEDDWQPKFYKWPSQREDLIDDVDDALNHPDVIRENIEIFICPALRSKPSRQRGTNAPLWWVWADVDHKPDENTMEKINALGGMTVLSGSDGHRHVYLPLDKPVTPLLHKALCLALKEALGATDSKIAENDLLRLPGTINWKRTEPKRVFLKSRARRKRSATFWKDMLCSMASTRWEVFADQARATTPKDLGAINENTKRPKLKGEALKCFRYNPTNDGQRHDAIYKLVRTMKEEGYTRDQTHATAREYPPAISKWGTDWRISNDVDRIWQKYKLPERDKPSIHEHLSEEDDGLEQPELQFHVWGKVVDRVRRAPAPKYLFDGVWVEGDYGVVSAQDKAGKSWAMGDAAISAASASLPDAPDNIRWMNTWACNDGGPVIICFGEGSERKQVRRLEAIARSKGLTDEQFINLPIHAMFSVPQIGDDQHMLELEAKIQAVKPALVIVDPFYLAAAGSDSANLSSMGALLQRIQLACQRHGTALMVSHHWNKTGNGDAHSRTSGVGLTAWGRVLMSIEVIHEHMDPNSKRSSVRMQWHIKGDEIPSQVMVITRDVWEDTPGDLTSRMNYELSESAEPGKSEGVHVNAGMIERIMATLEENRQGLGFRKIMDKSKERGTPVGRPSLNKHLPLLEEHGYIRLQKAERPGYSDNYVFLKPFSTKHLIDGMLPPLDPHATPATYDVIKASEGRNPWGRYKPATPRQVDMSALPKFQPKRRRTRMNA